MELSLKNLTLVAGKNAAGKSTVLQSLLLLKQSYELRYLQDSQLCFSDRVVLADLESYASVYSHDPDEGDPSFWIRIEDEKQTEWTFQVAGQEEQGRLFLSSRNTRVIWPTVPCSVIQWSISMPSVSVRGKDIFIRRKGTVWRAVWETFTVTGRPPCFMIPLTSRWLFRRWPIRREDRTLPVRSMPG